jgi:salicylate hydroxylase
MFTGFHYRRWYRRLDTSYRLAAARRGGGLGVLDAVTVVSTEPTELIYRNLRDGHRIAADRVSQDLQYQKGAPFYGVHRADRQRMLRDALWRRAASRAPIDPNLVGQGGTVGLEFANGRFGQADLVIGADPLRSPPVRYWQ